MPKHPPVRWKDPGIWPRSLSMVPEGHHVVTSREEADKHFESYLVFSVKTRVSRRTYSRLWKLAMDTGFQPNGLLIASLSGLQERLRMDSDSAPRDFGRWAQDNDLLRRIPGKLLPAAPKEVPGGRHRMYLVLGGTCDHCVVPRRPSRF